MQHTKCGVGGVDGGQNGQDKQDVDSDSVVSCEALQQLYMQIMWMVMMRMSNGSIDANRGCNVGSAG